MLLKRMISIFDSMENTVVKGENCIPICQYFWHHTFICCWIGRAQNWHTRESDKILLQPFQRYSSSTLCSIDTHFNRSTTDCFWKHCRKRRNCSLLAISSFPTMFSTQSDNCIPICQYFWHHTFICCWIVRVQNWHMKERVKRLRVKGKQLKH